MSESAVSRTFRNGSVSPEVRARVMEAARVLAYRPNAMARAVTTRRSDVIAIVMTAQINSHFPEALSELSHAAARHNLRAMLFTMDQPALVSEAVDQILSYQIDGVLSLTEVPAADARILESNGVELVLYNFSESSVGASLVSCDHRAAGYALGRHLLELGHRSFGLVEGPAMSNLASERAGGVLDALGEAGIAAGAVPTARGDFGYEGGRAATAALLDGGTRPGAIVAVNDIMAIGAIDELSGRGLHVPEDVSVAGFDGVAAGTWDRYRLTTMRQPLRQLADAGVETIVRKLANPGRAHEKRLLTCDLVPGGSARLVG